MCDMEFMEVISNCYRRDEFASDFRILHFEFVKTLAVLLHLKEICCIRYTPY